jgi:Fur family peroxide stress response transcriptional regulator
MGEIIKITTGDGADRFDGRITPHNHFICRKCHKVSDLEMESIDSILGIAQKNFPGKIDSHVTNFYGICGDCIKKP